MIVIRKFKKVRTLYLILICLIIISAKIVFASDPLLVMNKWWTFPMPIWVSLEKFSSSVPSLFDTVMLGDKKVKLSPPCGPVFSSVYYSGLNILVIVEKNGIVRVYKSKNASFNLTDMRSPSHRARTEAVHFTRIPGLLYILTINLDEEERMKDKLTDKYSDRYERIDFWIYPNRYEGIPLNKLESGTSILEAYYSLTNKGINLRLGTKKRVFLPLSVELDKPFRNGIGDSLAQAVFIFSDKAIVSKIKNGWAIHDINGQLLKQFSTSGKAAVWCDDPIYREGNFFVKARGGDKDREYKLDISSGTMILHSE